MKKVHIIFRLLKVAYEINKVNNVHSRYHREAKKIIDETLAQFDLQGLPFFQSQARLKMQWYMAEWVYACEFFNWILGKKSTLKQRYSFYLSGILAALSDLVIDDIEMDEERIKLLKRPPKSFLYRNEIERLYVTQYHNFIELLEENVKVLTLYYYELGFDAQLHSKQQLTGKLSKEQADQICKDKGGYSALFIGAIVGGEIPDKEKKIWFEFGAFIQFCNDAQDLYKDLTKGISTFATVRKQIEVISEDIGKQMETAFLLIKEAPFEYRKKDELLLTLHVMYLGILAKLYAFSRLCKFKFSFEKFLLTSKAEVRSATHPLRLVPFVFKQAINYTYQNSHIPISPNFRK